MAKQPPSSQLSLERLSDAFQEAIKVVVGTHRKPPRRLKSFLNGTWFGHPLHPVITDVPIAAWLLTAIFDIIWLIAPTRASWAGLGPLWPWSWACLPRLERLPPTGCATRYLSG
jgi:hypothetical protein